MILAGHFRTVLGCTLDGVTLAVRIIRGSLLLCYPVVWTTFTLYMTPRETGFLPKSDAESIITFTRRVGKAPIFSSNRTYFEAHSKNCEKRLLASSCLPFHLNGPSVLMEQLTPTGQIFSTVDIRELLESLWRKFRFLGNLT